jgi:hypothetical protein
VSDPAAMVAALDLRSCCCARVLRDVADPGLVRALLARQTGIAVRDAPRLLLVDDASAAPTHRAGLAALAADRGPASVLLVMVGPAGGSHSSHGEPAHGDPERGDPERGDPARGDPARGDPARGDPAPPVTESGTDVCGDPLVAIAFGEHSPHDLDGAYDPALYRFLEHHPDGSAQNPDLPDSPEERTSGPGAAPSARPVATPSGPPSTAPTRTPSGAIPAILWVGGLDERPGPTSGEPIGGDRCGSRPDHPPALCALLDALRSPEVFDRVCHEVATMPGRLAFPGIDLVVGRLPEETLRALRVRSAQRFVTASSRRRPAEPVPADRERLRREVEAALAARLPLAEVHRRLTRTLQPAGGTRLCGITRRLSRPVRRRVRTVTREPRRGRAPAGLLAGHTAELLHEIRAYADALTEDIPSAPGPEQPGVSHAVAAALADHEDELAVLLDTDLADLALAAMAPVWAELAAGGPLPTAAALGRSANDLLDAYSDHLRDAGVLAAPRFGSSAEARLELARRVWRAAPRPWGGDARTIQPGGRAPVIRQLVDAGQAGLLDPRPQAARLIMFAPEAARSPACSGSMADDTRSPVWTAASLVAGVLLLTPARTADAARALFPDRAT